MPGPPEHEPSLDVVTAASDYLRRAVHAAIGAGASKPGLAAAVGLPPSTLDTWLGQPARCPADPEKLQQLDDQQLRDAIARVAAARAAGGSVVREITQGLVAHLRAAEAAGWSERQMTDAAGVPRGSIRGWLKRQPWNHKTDDRD